MTDDDLDREDDEADLALMEFVDLMRQYGIKPAEAVAFAADRIPELYLAASEPDLTH